MKFFFLVVMALMLNGCTAATWKMLYCDAKVVYKDAKNVVQEVKEAKK